ncbi:MAG: phytanoyl-CoA dioxygenase family protein [Alphaproteobacteria bacterium]|nr:phytanoyl-CoA dioxygenase family protein [Alphaproteobacteria bacterium]
MPLTPDVLSAFHDRGFLVQPQAFVFDEIAWVRDEARVVALRRGQAGHARSSDPFAGEAPEGTVYGAHVSEPAFRKLSAHPRIVGVARELLGQDVYVHQSRLISRFAEVRSDVTWRRDFASWSAVDGLPAPHAVTAAIVLGDTDPSEPILQVAAGSQRQGFDDLGAPDDCGGSLGVWAPVGSVVFYHGNLAYSLNRRSSRRSPPLFLVSYNAVSNPPTRARHDELFAARHVAPIVVEADDCMWPTAWCAAG